ncbi:hypothetical protein D3C81_1624630 [compost metagenome]
MHTPTPTIRENKGAPSIICCKTPGTPTHSKITGRFGKAPNLSIMRHPCHQGKRVACNLSNSPMPILIASETLPSKPNSFQLANGDVSFGSTTISAPHCSASLRRFGEKSLATTVLTPAALSIKITPNPTGPQPITIAGSLVLTRLRRTACNATAIGSVMAALSASRPLGTSNIKLD